MKALIISASDLAGGAAIAASRLHRGLMAAGVETRMLVQDKQGAEVSVAAVEPDMGASNDWLRSLNAHVNRNARTAVSNTSFSLPWPGTTLCQHPWVLWADVINLHWVSGFVSPETVRELLALGKPVVWTLHDQRPFTGGCHYTAGCTGFHSTCESCPQLQPAYQSLPALALQLALQSLRGVPPLAVVSPSRWLAEEARRSRIFAGCRVETVPNSLDLEVFKPGDRAAIRAKLGLPTDALVMMFGAYTLVEHRKGFDLLSQSIHQALTHPDIAARHEAGELVFAAYGKDEDTLRKSGLPVVLLGTQETPEQMALTLSAADLVICPTREDNLPNVVMEAMACGVPVLACDVGGVPDMITDGVHGRLVPPENSAALTQALTEIIRNPSVLSRWGAQARAKCESEYPLHRQGQDYATLFQSLLAQPLPSPSHPGSLAAVQTELLKALAEAQGRQVTALKYDNTRLVDKARAAKASVKPPAEVAVKVIEQELKARRGSRLLRWLSPTIWALRRVRHLLRKLK